MKKSYMNREETILQEGFFDKIKRVFGISTSDQKKIHKDTKKKVDGVVADLNKDVEEFEKLAQEMYNDMGIKKKVNIRRYKIQDLLPK